MPGRQALAGVRVLDLSGTVATGYCGKLFADHGAEVINLEPPEGFATRALPPLFADAPPLERSAMHTYLNVHKHSVGLDWRDPARRDALMEWIAGADVVLEGETPGRLEAAGLGFEVLCGAKRDLVLSSITWFGQSGPYATRAGTDAIVQSLAGLVRPIGPVEGPPLLPRGHHAQIVGAVTAFVATQAELLARILGNAAAATHLDTSIFEANLCFTEVGAVVGHNTGMTVPRLGINRFPPTYPLGIYPCRDGWIGVTALTPAQWRAFCGLLDLGAEASNPDYATALGRLADADRLDPLIAERVRGWAAEELFHRGQAARIPLALVPAPAALPGVDQYRQRHAFVDIGHPDQGFFTAPATPFHLLRTPARGAGVAARLDADRDMPPSRMLREQPELLEECRPLAGIRVLDLSMGWAGPLATRHLADLGADVLKVEACRHVDWWRGWEASAEWVENDMAEKAVPFNTMNRGKRDITLDLTSTDGKALLLRLVMRVDVVVENYSGGVLRKLGLGHDALTGVNPDLVTMSMPAFGASGPWRDYRAYGSTVEQASGLPHLNGRANDPPTMLHVAYGDPVGGLNAAAGILVALAHRALTGEGQRLDLSQSECLFPLAADGIIGAAIGAGDAEAALRGVYRTSGDDCWITIELSSTDALARLKALAAPALAGFGDLADALARRDELDTALGDWSCQRDADDLMQTLQRAGIAAGVVRASTALLGEPQLEARGFWQWLDRAFVGRQPQPSAPYRRSAVAEPLTMAAPTLGADNDAVLAGELGLDADTIAGLRRAGVIGERPVVDV